MKTKDYINLLQATKEILPGEKSAEMVDEIIQRLREYDELKALVLKFAPVLREIGEFLGVYWDDE